MRTTRSMARISDAVDYPQRRTSQAEGSHRQLSSLVSSASRLSSRQTARLQNFEPDSPEAKPIPHMESPKKGRFDDFEFEVEDSALEVPTRRRRLEIRPSAQTAQAPPSRQLAVESRSHRAANTALTSSRKENTLAQSSQVSSHSSPVKPEVAPRVSRLTTSVEPSVKQERTHVDPIKRAAAPQNSLAASAEPSMPQIPTRQLTFTATHSPMKRNPFTAQNDIDSLARLGESRHSPIKRIQVKSEFVLQSPERPDRKPINLLDLKPSPGKAQRGIFRHNFADEDEEEDIEAVEDAKPVSRNSLAKAVAAQGIHTVSIPSRGTSSRLHDDATVSMSGAARKVLSAETKDALASLEASLTRLSSRSNVVKSESTLERDIPKRVLGRSSMLPSSRTQVFTSTKYSSTGESSVAETSVDQAGDDSLFKKPIGRVSALSKSRQSSSQLSGPVSGSVSRLPAGTLLGNDASKASSSESRDDPASISARSEEVQRRAALQAARRKSTQSFLSAGMPPPMIRRPLEQNQEKPPVTASSTASALSSADAEVRKEAREARRRSLYTYVPTKREDVESGDRSVGNVSASLVICAAPTVADADGSAQTVKRTRFLRGLTVLVDVRDQDGEDASARWVEMLKNAGAKVMLRFGERKLTHIVYKSGRPSTLHSYRALADPKPHVVGISWVVKCLEEGQQVDEEPYLVEVAKQAIFTNVSGWSYCA